MILYYVEFIVYSHGVVIAGPSVHGYNITIIINHCHLCIVT